MIVTLSHLKFRKKSTYNGRMWCTLVRTQSGNEKYRPAHFQVSNTYQVLQRTHILQSGRMTLGDYH